MCLASTAQPGEVIHGEFHCTDVLSHWFVEEKASHLPIVGKEVQRWEMAVLIEVGLSHEPGVYPEIRDATDATGINGRFKLLDELRHVGAVGSFHISFVGT